MNKAGRQLSAMLFNFEEFPNGSMPLEGKIKPGKLVSIHKSFDRLLHLVLLGMVVDPYLFPESIIPEAVHDLHEGLLKGIITDHDCSKHPLMPGGMDTVVNGKSQMNGSSHLLCLAPHRFSDTGHQKSVKTTDRMMSMIFCGTHGNDDDIVFSAGSNQLFSDGILNIASRFFHLSRRRDLIVFEQCIDLFVGHVIDLLFQLSNRSVL